ncbi:hypothetical protein NPX13_g6467 [Xylaria arbuscula]|uniref:Clr5 domain-containing protein n=1 Tax=Xylaria arbuscula TaxID=114810 RepID=A0A9W8TLE1_9PEZI|nr:hypothetical protein NPX13_g6467 [Xylaria arbuscula]
MPTNYNQRSIAVAKAKWASEDDFIKHRQTITELYSNTTVSELIDIMEKQYGFFATTKMYKSRFRRWGLWKHDPGTSSSSAAIYRIDTPVELRDEEVLYQTLRDYYDASFSSRRWVFDGGSAMTEQELPAYRQAVERTNQAMSVGEEIYERFRAALGLLERPSHGNNGGKEGDFAQGVRLIRISFAELSHTLSSAESPLLAIWMIYVMVMFRESSARDFRPIEQQLTQYLYELTSCPLANGDGGRPLHPTARLWSTLWSGGRGFAINRYHLLMCSAIAIEQFSHHIGYFHPLTVELSGLGIGLMHPNGVGDPDDKTKRFRDLSQQLETLDIYDTRHITVVCCWASHYRHHGSPELLEEGITLLDGVLGNPDKARAVHEDLEGAFNIYSLLCSMNYKLGRLIVAENSMRHAINIAIVHRARTGEEGDLFEGLNGLEVVLRAQGKIKEADEVQEERKRLVHETLEIVGETDDSV